MHKIVVHVNNLATLTSIQRGKISNCLIIAWSIFGVLKRKYCRKLLKDFLSLCDSIRASKMKSKLGSRGKIPHESQPLLCCRYGTYVVIFRADIIRALCQGETQCMSIRIGEVRYGRWPIREDGYSFNPFGRHE